MSDIAVMAADQAAAEVHPAEASTHGHCANCRAALTGPFCAACGQSAETLKRPAWELIEHALEAFFHFDTRGLQSLKLLVAYPGKLTSEYLAGRRAPFVPPVRFYILTSLFFFLALWITGTAILQVQDVVNADGSDTFDYHLFEPLDRTPRAAPKGIRENIQIKAGDKTPVWFDRFLAGVDRAFTDPAALNDKLSELMPRLMFGLVPVFSLALWLLYIRRRRFLVEHLIFAAHFQTFIFLLATAMIVVRSALPDIGLMTPFLFIVAVYLLLALRRVYGQGWVKTAIKEIVLLAIYGFVFLAGMGASIVMGLAEL